MNEQALKERIRYAENIFAEKLESIVSRADANTRMKDYHDLILLCRAKDILDLSKLKKDIANTFKSRGEKKILPIKFSKKDIGVLQKLWEKHRDKLQGKAESFKLPANIKEAIAEINSWLLRNRVI